MFNGFDQLEDSNVVDMDISQVGLSMEISSGLGFHDTTGSEIESLGMAEIERVWGAYFRKIVKYSPAVGFRGSCEPFSLADVLHVLESKMTSTLNDEKQREDAVIFGLKDGRVAFVWVAHCDPVSCCGVCVFSTLGIMGPSEQDVRLSLPEEFKRYFALSRKSSNKDE